MIKQIISYTPLVLCLASSTLWADTCAEAAQSYLNTEELLPNTPALDTAADTLVACLTEKHEILGPDTAIDDFLPEFTHGRVSYGYSDCSETKDVSLMAAELLELCKRLD